GGTWRENHLYPNLPPPPRSKMSALPIVFGKAAAYFGLSILTIFYVFGFHYKAFGYPMRASFGELAGFFLPYLLAIIFLGITLASLFRKRENALLILLFTSIPLLMISGVSVPKEVMPGWLYEFGKIFPSSPGINGFIRLQTMGATLPDIRPELVNLWILAGIYFLTACLGMRGVAVREK
ncbi:MAG: ABC transporter permease, partial [Rikenellaceae bacterium]|nr:ABC transporter permease [Rikenellaceae bacterium]